MDTWLLAGVGLAVCVLLLLLLWRTTQTKTLDKTLKELAQRLDDWQRVFATQQQVEALRGDLSAAQSALVRLESDLRNLAQFTQITFQPELNRQIQEALQRLEGVREAVSSAQASIASQDQTLEQRHNQLLGQLKDAGEKITGVVTLLSEVNASLRERQSAVAKSLEEIGKDLGLARQTLEAVSTQVQVLATLSETVKRMETEMDRLTSVLLRRGGRVGERLVAEILSVFPADWVERNVKLGGGEVEFALRMPGNRFVPIDSKFVAQELLQELDKNSDNEEKRRQIAKQIEQQVQIRAKEIAKYLTDERTLGFGVMAVPDPVYSECRDAVRAVSENHRIVVVSYSLLVPFTLSLYHMAQRLGIPVRLGDVQQLVGTAQQAVERALQALENMDRELKAANNQRVYAINQLDVALRAIRQVSQGEIGLPSELPPERQN